MEVETGRRMEHDRARKFLGIDIVITDIRDDVPVIFSEEGNELHRSEFNGSARAIDVVHRGIVAHHVAVTAVQMNLQRNAVIKLVEVDRRGKRSTERGLLEAVSGGIRLAQVFRFADPGAGAGGSRGSGS